MSEISSGLVAVAWQVRNGWSSCDLHRTLKSATEDRDMLQKRADLAGNLMAYRVEPLVRLSDAEAVISKLSSKDRYGVCDECGTPYAFDPTDGGAICIKCQKDKIAQKDAEIERLERESSACDLLDEQKGTITALNMALGGEDSTSTENLIDAHDIDYNEEGLISLCRKLIAENVRLSDVIESTAINDTIEALGFANREIERLTTSENDWITCHAKIWRELQETKTIVGNQAERIAAKDAEILEQCRINGMGAEREAALLGKAERQSAALKLAKVSVEKILAHLRKTSYWVQKDPLFDYAQEALAAIDALNLATAPTPPVSEDRRDAERYRWLREQHWSESKLCVVLEPRISVRLGSSCPSLTLLDQAIDQAMQEDKP